MYSDAKKGYMLSTVGKRGLQQAFVDTGFMLELISKLFLVQYNLKIYIDMQSNPSIVVTWGRMTK